jgi:hypothetical protein
VQIIDIRLFVAGTFLSKGTLRGDHVRLGERIDITYDLLDAEELNGADMNSQKGRIIVLHELIQLPTYSQSFPSAARDFADWAVAILNT